MFFVKGTMVAPLTTAGVSDEVAQEIQMPSGPRMLEDVEEPMLVRLATLRDPGTPNGARCASNPVDTIHHIENSRTSTQVVPQLQFDYGYMGDGGLLQIVCFFAGADTSSGATRDDGALRCRKNSQVGACPGV